jgi:tRNA (pseudouridine54-N1)-methyltransferase
MDAGRMDIVCHAVISTFFLSNAMRDDVKLQLILNGPPNPPRCIEFVPTADSSISKKDVGNLIRSALWKHKEGKKVEAFPGIFIEKKSLQRVLDDHTEPIFYLDPKGKDIAEIDFPSDPVFVLGDHDGIPKDEKKYLKKHATAISIGNKTYFTSQCISFLNMWLDRKN